MSALDKEPVLQVKDLNVVFETNDGPVHAVNELSLDLMPGETLSIVGESGSGKSQAFLGLMGLLAKNGRASGEALFDNHNLLALPSRALDRYRGGDIAMIFQDPMTALHPSLRISRQLTEVLERHQGMDTAKALQAAVAMLENVGIPDPKRRIHRYPHELSGGMRQRVMIAMALLCNPKVLIADEPTTALDVTIQAQILDLFAKLKTDMGTALVLVTHDLGVVARLADRVMVMYGGRAVEVADVDTLFTAPGHPYTRALLASMPHIDRDDGMLTPIDGSPPDLSLLPEGCAFSPRCTEVFSLCNNNIPALITCAPGHAIACLREGERGIDPALLTTTERADHEPA